MRPEPSSENTPSPIEQALLEDRERTLKHLAWLNKSLESMPGHEPRTVPDTLTNIPLKEVSKEIDWVTDGSDVYEYASGFHESEAFGILKEMWETHTLKSFPTEEIEMWFCNVCSAALVTGFRLASGLAARSAM